MRIEFTADTATFDEIEETQVCGLAMGDGADTTLMFLRAPDDGLDDCGVYLEYNDEKNAGYDAISACRLRRDRVEVDLAGPLGGLEGVEGFDVSLQVDDPTFQSFADGLAKVFKGEASALLNGAEPLN